MALSTQELVNKLWNLCNVLRDDGITYHQYLNELIEKFKYRHLLIEKLNTEHKGSFKFGEDNVLVINEKPILKDFWNIPKNNKEVAIYFKCISEKIESYRFTKK